MYIRDWTIRMLAEGGFGLEEENQRVTADGYLAPTPHPFPDDPVMDRDFCESQLEMITKVHHTPEEAVRALGARRREAAHFLAQLPEPEYLWPFSNPPYLSGEDDIRIAQFTGELAGKTEYREYLAGKYGKRLECLCGIHFNYSYPSSYIDFLMSEGVYPDQIYLNLAEKVLANAWLIVALTAASPVMDGSYFEDGKLGESVYGEYSSYRCSERGYWNAFEPVIDFDAISTYLDSMNYYVDTGELISAAELYYPVRLKPSGMNTIENLAGGIDHIELRMIDVNPLCDAGIDVRDVEFLTLFIIYLTAKSKVDLSVMQQRESIRNMKRAAHYPLEDVQLMGPDGKLHRLADSAEVILKDMIATLGPHEVIDFELEKIRHPGKRYTNQIIARYGKDYVGEGLKRARELAEK